MCQSPPLLGVGLGGGGVNALNPTPIPTFPLKGKEHSHLT